MKRVDFHQKAYSCLHVLSGERPVLYVDRAFGDWCLLCGEPHEDGANDIRTLGIGHLLEDDPTLESILDLPPNWEAEREARGADWVRNAVLDNPERDDLDEVRAHVIGEASRRLH